MLFGDIVKVTPSSKVVGDMALFLVSHDMTMDDSSNGSSRSINLTLPNSVVEMFYGIARRARRRLAEEAAEDHPARREAAARPARRAPAAGRSRGSHGATVEEEDRPRDPPHATC